MERFGRLYSRKKKIKNFLKLLKPVERLMAEAKAGTQLASSAESSDTVKEMYRAFYNNIIKNQNLQVVADGTKQIYDDI